MIVTQQEGLLQIVTQIEHARLSYEFARVQEMGKSLGSVVLEAIRHHDDGWETWDERPGLSDGSPRDYRTMKIEDHLRIMRRSIEVCLRRDPYEGWLVSRHGTSFHEGKPNLEAQQFMKDELERRRWLRGLHQLPEPSQRERDFDWLQFSDALSLYVLDPWTECWEWNRETPDKLSVRALEPGVVKINKPLFGPKTRSFPYRYRTVDDRTYESREEFRQSLKDVPHREDTIRIHPPG